MKERFAVTNPKAQHLRFHVQTGGVTLTAQQPDNNVVRVALQALAAVLGGCQSLHTNGKDEALALPTEDSARLALRTQQLIAYESGVADTVDPLGGSYAVVKGLREVLPFLTCILVYTNLHDTIGFVNPHDIHDALAALDRGLFGVIPCVWAQQFISPGR